MSNESDLWGVVTNPTMGMAPYALKILRQNNLVRTVRLEPDVTYIGRMPENHVVLDDGKVSRSHARIIRKGKDFVVEDQESENGIYVNGKKVQECILKPGLQIGVGGHILEVVNAQMDDRPAIRESQLEKAEEEEWRMDQTISGTPEQIAKMVQARNATLKPAAKAPAPQAPKMSVQFKFGSKTLEKDFEFTQARPRKEGDSAEESIEIKVTTGKWVLYKKIPM